MVIPPTERFESTTLEDRLAKKFDELQVARERKESSIIDEYTRSIEVLLRAVPDAFEELMREKERLNRMLNEESHSVMMEAQASRDEISREYIVQTRMEKAMWDYRELYEEVIIEVLLKYGLIAIRKEKPSVIQGFEETPQPVMQDYQQDEVVYQREEPQQSQYQQQPSHQSPLPPPPPQQHQQQKQTSQKRFLDKIGKKQEKTFEL